MLRCGLIQREREYATIADTDAAGGTITLVFQEIGKTTIARKLERAIIMDIAGPLGIPSSWALNGYALSAADSAAQ